MLLRLDATDHAVQANTRWAGSRKAVTVWRILDLSRRPDVLVEIFEKNRVRLVGGIQCPIDRQRATHNLAIGKEQLWDCPLFVPHRRQEITGPAMARPGCLEDGIERVRDLIRRTKFEVELVAADIRASRQGHDRIKIDLARRAPRSVV